MSHYTASPSPSGLFWRRRRWWRRWREGCFPLTLQAFYQDSIVSLWPVCLVTNDDRQAWLSDINEQMSCCAAGRVLILEPLGVFTENSTQLLFTGRGAQSTCSSNPPSPNYKSLFLNTRSLFPESLPATGNKNQWWRSCLNMSRYLFLCFTINYLNDRRINCVYQAGKARPAAAAAPVSWGKITATLQTHFLSGHRTGLISGLRVSWGVKKCHLSSEKENMI